MSHMYLTAGDCLFIEETHSMDTDDTDSQIPPTNTRSCAAGSLTTGEYWWTPADKERMCSLIGFESECKYRKWVADTSSWLDKTVAESAWRI